MSCELRDREPKPLELLPLNIVVDGTVVGEVAAHKRKNGLVWFFASLKGEVLTPSASGDSQIQAIERAIINGVKTSRKAVHRMEKLAAAIGIDLKRLEEVKHEQQNGT